jgi:hypothetical protein
MSNTHPPIFDFDYHTPLVALGCKYLGPCACKHMRGYMYASPAEPGIELWVYPQRKIVRKKDHGATRETYPFTADSFVQLSKVMLGL